MPPLASGWFRSRPRTVRRQAPTSAIIRHMTNNPRIYLWVALALMVWLNYDAWQRDYGARPDAITNVTRPANGNPTTSAANDLANQVPQGAERNRSATPCNQRRQRRLRPATSTPDTSAAAGTGAAPVIHVHTDVLDMDISTARRHDPASRPAEIPQGKGRGRARPPGKPGRSASACTCCSRA